MKFSSLSLLFLFTLLSCSLFAQKSGVIKYTQVVKLNIVLDSEDTHGMDLSSMLPDSRTTYNDLYFNQNESVYEEVEAEMNDDIHVENEDATIQIEIVQDDTEEKLYHHYGDKIRLNQTGFMGKEFLIEEAIEKVLWKITGEKLKYLDYECIKATTTNEEGEIIVAWFAPQIPQKIGPDAYGQLPGAILMLSVGEDQRVFKATEVTFMEDVDIKKPTKGKKVTSEEYEKIVEDKMKEMEMQYGKGSMIIRG